jgi:hypothetical protein
VSDPIEGVLAQRDLPDGRILSVQPLTFGRARLCIGTNEWTYDDGY